MHIPDTTYLDIFDVQHGACALITCTDGQHVMIDCGHNAETGWKPGNYLASKGIGFLDRLYVTNYDEDHVSGIGNLFEKAIVGTLWRNLSVSPETIKLLKTEDGMGPGIDILVRKTSDEYYIRTDGTALPNVIIEAFCNSYGAPFVDENNLSLVVKVKIHGISFLFPGDLERAGWMHLLKNDAFRLALKDVTVFVASHHGRESGCCDEVFEAIGPSRPQIVVISDKWKGYQTQETTDYYRSKTHGGVELDGTQRHVLTTRNDGGIQFSISATAANVLIRV